MNSPYIPPFKEIASIVITGNDFAHARWIGAKDLPVNFSYLMIPCIENLPWKMIEVLDEPDYQIRWFKRID